MARHVVKTRPRGAQHQAAGDEHRRAIQRTHTTPHIRTARSPYARSPACNPAHHSNGIFTSARSPQHALRSSSERNPTESSTPLGFVLAPPKELTAYCSACASAYNPLAARLPACTARSLQHAQRSSSERNPTKSSTPLGFVLAPLKELTAYCSACASAYNPLAARLPACTARSLFSPRTHGFRSTTIPAVIKAGLLSIPPSGSSDHDHAQGPHSCAHDNPVHGSNR